MRLLTYQEIDILFDRAATLRPVLIDGKPIIFSTLTRGDECINFAHAIIAATVAKLTAGVSVEPVWFTVTGPDAKQRIYTASESHPENCIPLYTATAIAAARVQALEEAVKVCEGASSYLEHQQHLLASRDCANAIRALIGGAT